MSIWTQRYRPLAEVYSCGRASPIAAYEWLNIITATPRFSAHITWCDCDPRMLEPNSIKPISGATKIAAAGRSPPTTSRLPSSASMPSSIGFSSRTPSVSLSAALPSLTFVHAWTQAGYDTVGHLRIRPRRRSASSRKCLEGVDRFLRQQPRRTAPTDHEAIEECAQSSGRIERENVRNILIRSHSNDAPLTAINASHIKDVIAAA